MSDWSKVRVRLDREGGLAGVDVEGEIDRDKLTEERPETPPLPDDPDARRKLWPLG
jgi:hypothetical protein